jgi:hypothetical protein
MSELEGQRIDGGTEAIYNAKAGAYWPTYVKGDESSGIYALWFKLPTGTVGRIPAEHPARQPGVEDPCWTITEDDEGRVTVDPSILQGEIGKPDDPHYVPPWHGWLRAGVWSW